MYFFLTDNKIEINNMGAVSKMIE